MTSEWNDFYHGNWPQPLTGPACVKAGEGLSFTDPSYQAYVARGARWAYYALHTKRPADQARRAASIIGARPAMFDVEYWKQESGSPAGIATVPEVCTAVDTYRGVGGVMNVIYFPRSVWEKLGAPSLAPLVQRGLHFINADYRSGSATPGSAAWSGYGGAVPWAVQYAACHNIAREDTLGVEDIWEGVSHAPVPVVQPTVRTTVYQVKAGDNLSVIANHHGMSLAQLERLNPHAGHPAGHVNTIWPGDHITVWA